MLRRDFYGKSKARRPHFIEHPDSSFRTNNSLFTGFLSEILINLTNECEEKPHSAMKEECTLICYLSSKQQRQMHSFDTIYPQIY